MASIQAFRDIANNTSVSDRRYVYFANGEDDKGVIQEKQSLCFNAAGKPRNFQKPSEQARKTHWGEMRQRLRTLVADKLGEESDAFKEIEKKLFGKLVGGKFDPKAAEQPLRKRDVVKVLRLMDKAICDRLDTDALKAHLLKGATDRLQTFLACPDSRVDRQDQEGGLAVTLVPQDRMGEARRLLADLVNKVVSKPLPPSTAELAKLKKKFVADFGKAGFLDEEPGCEKSVYAYQGKSMTGQAAAKREIINRFFDFYLSADFRDFNPSNVKALDSKLMGELNSRMDLLKSIASAALGKYEGAKGGNGYMGLTDGGLFVEADSDMVGTPFKFLTHSKERKALAAGKVHIKDKIVDKVNEATDRLRRKLLELAESVDEGLKRRVEGILEEETVEVTDGMLFPVKRSIRLLSRVNVARALDEIAKSFVGWGNARFSWDDVKHADTYSDTTLVRALARVDDGVTLEDIEGGNAGYEKIGENLLKEV